MNFLEVKPGTSVEGDIIKAYRSEKKAPTYTYIMAGVHGDEVEGVYVLDELFKWLQSVDETPCSYIIIPILNVDGYRAGTRVNSHGVDLNRNYPTDSWTSDVRDPKYHPGSAPLSEPENKFLDKLFNKYPPHFILTLHSWKPIVNFNGDCEEAAEFIAKYNGYKVAGDIGYPTPGSLGEYAPTKFNSPVITFECPVLAEGKNLKEIWEENEEGLKNFLLSPYVAPKN